MFKKIFTFILINFFSMAALATMKTYKVEGMSCESCAKKITRSFEKLEVVTSVTVNVEQEIVTIDFKDGEALSDKEVSQKLSKLGYKIKK